MSKTVILAEKPSQALAYADAFSKTERKDGYYIVSDCDFLIQLLPMDSVI